MLNKIIKYFLENKLITLLLLCAMIVWGISTAPFNWDDSFNTDQDLISKEELDCLFDNNGWNGFYEKYPDSKGYLKFGLPIQNDNNEALVTFELLCYWECSSGYTATLIKENGKWKVRDVINVWIS